MAAALVLGPVRRVSKRLDAPELARVLLGRGQHLEIKRSLNRPALVLQVAKQLLIVETFFLAHRACL